MTSNLIRTLLIAFLFTIGTAGCENEGPFEEAGENIDETTEEASEKIEESAEAASEKIEETAENARERME